MLLGAYLSYSPCPPFIVRGNPHRIYSYKVDDIDHVDGLIRLTHTESTLNTKSGD